MQSIWKPFLLMTLLCAAVIGVAQSVPAQAAPKLAPMAYTVNPATVFINEIHYDNDGADVGEFVEIAGPAGTDLTGWSLVLYNGSNGTAYDTDALSGTIPDLGGGFGVVTVSYSGNLQNGSPDGVALVDSSNSVVQFLSYEGVMTASDGVANELVSTDIGVSEGASETIGQSLQLSGIGSVYADFTWGAPSTETPGAFNSGQTFAAGDIPPFVSSTTPVTGSAGVALDANITVNFSEDVTVTGTWFDITCASSGAHTATVSGGPQSYTLDPDGDYTSGESCTVTIVAAQVADQDDSADNMAADYSWSFTTSNMGVCFNESEDLIHDVQSSGETSPLVGSVVVVEGVVTGDYQGSSPLLRGFYLQEEDADIDADATTSEGIFVFSDIAVNAGDVVRVEGTVTEFGDPGEALTELASVTQLQVCATGASVTPTVINLPVSSLAVWEQVEGMLVSFPQRLTVTENFTLGRYGDVHLSSGGRLYQPTHLVAPGAPAQAQLELNERNRILLDDAQTAENPDPVIYPSPYLSATNTLRSGYTVDNLTGILDQRFDLYRVQPVGEVLFNPANPRTESPEAIGGTLKVASANVLNYFITLDDGGDDCGPVINRQECRGANTPEEFERQRTKSIGGLVSIDADIVGLVEMENNATASLQDLVDGLNDILGADTYAYINTGFIGTDAIKVGIIYKPAAVTPIGDYEILDSAVDPTFIDTLNRPVLAQTFQENASGERFTVAVNHLKSKGSDCNSVGDPDTGDGQGNCNNTRTTAAAALVNWLATDPTDSGDPDFLIIGDLNSYVLEDPITTIKNAGYTDLLAAFQGEGAYSYVFDGQSGYLDHALASFSLLGQVVGATEWHVNTDEPNVLDYNVEFKSAAQVDYFYTPEAYRFSDHDPLVVWLNWSPEIALLGKGETIASGDDTPAASDGTDFGAVNVGDAVTHTFVISNSGNITLSLTGTPLVEISGLASGEFVVTQPLTSVIAAQESVTFTVRYAPSAHGSHAITVTIANDDGDENPYTFGVQGHGIGQYALDVSKVGTGNGTVTSTPAGIDCGVTCTTTLSHGTVVTLTANAAASSTFAGWSGACNGTHSCVVTVDEAKSVTATFTLKDYSLTVNKEGTGSGTVTSTPAGIDCGESCAAIYAHGTVVTLNAVAAADSTFSGWSGACTGTDACVVTMDAAKNVVANFILNTYTLSVSTSGTGTGSVTSTPEGINCGDSCVATYAQDTNVTLTPIPTEGSAFINWAGACNGSGACVVSLDAAKSVIAIFDLVTVPVAAINLVKTVSVQSDVCGTDTTLTVLPGETVYYCYTVTNSGNVTLTQHSLVDDQVGTITHTLSTSLVPGQTISTVALGFSVSAQVEEQTTNLATWTAVAQTEALSTTATSTATVSLGEAAYEVNLAGAFTPPSGGGVMGGELNYEVGIRNNGTATLKNVQIVFVVPMGTVFSPSAGSSHAASSHATWDCPEGAPAGTLCTYTIAVLPPGQEVKTVLTLRVVVEEINVDEVVVHLDVMPEGTPLTPVEPVEVIVVGPDATVREQLFMPALQRAVHNRGRMVPQ